MRKESSEESEVASDHEMTDSSPPTVYRRVRSNQETLYQLVQVLEVLSIGLDAYRAGRYSAWMIISARLHQLLTDRANGNTPLALRVLPWLSFHPTIYSVRNTGNEVLDIMLCPATIRMTPKDIQIEIFDLSQPRISLVEDWLKQLAYIIQRKPLTIQDFITFPRHQAGGVHYDPTPKDKMPLIEGVLLGISNTKHRLSFHDYVVALGEYVHYAIENQLVEALGNGYMNSSNVEKAGTFFKKGLADAEQRNDLQGQCHHAIGLAWHFETMLMQDEAIDALRKVLSLSDKLRDCVSRDTALCALPRIRLAKANAVANRGDAGQLQALYREALSSLELVWKLRRADQVFDALSNEAAILTNLGFHYRDSGDSVKAVVLLFAAVLIAQGIEPSAHSWNVFQTAAGALRGLSLKLPGFGGLVEEACSRFNEIVRDEYGFEREFQRWTADDFRALLEEVQMLIDQQGKDAE